MDDIGRYRIMGELGRGGMGIVYRAYDPVLGREVAIKTLKLTELSDPAERDELRDRLAREARAAAALSHAGIVGIFDVVQQGDVLGLVMERIEGSTLASLLTSGRSIDLDTALRVVRETAAALDYAHRKGIVHRDIKPANMMLDESGTVKVADFGIAKITTSQTRTQSDRGMIVGTAGYMAPEQLRGEVIDGHADQFSLAVVAYEMIARRRPFVADSLISLTHQVVFAQPPTLSSLRPGLGPGVDSVFLTALAKLPPERFPNCCAFAAALETQVRAAIGQPTVAYPFTPSGPPPATYVPPGTYAPVPTPSQAIPPMTFAPPTYAPTATARPKRKSHWFTWVMAVILFVGGVAAMGFGVFSYFQRKAAEDAQVDPDPVPAAKSEPSKAKPEPVAATPNAKVAVAAKTSATLVGVKAGTVRVNPKDGQKYVWIAPGEFMMGCIPDDSECGSFAKPQHRVTISAGFWMAQTETTVTAYRSFATKTHRDLPKAPKFNPDWGLGDHPMVETSWDDANAYCTWAGGRLPTEAEFEYAARGGATTIFPWGSQPSHDHANFGQGTSGADEKGAMEGKDQWLYTSPVASFPPNGFHLYDMVGNASEWCSDWFGQAWYSRSPEKDPKGPEAGSMRVTRGGSWKSPGRFMHTSFRGSRGQAERGTTAGFRCAINALP